MGNGDHSINLIPSSEEETYRMASKKIRNSMIFNFNDIPSHNYAEYLANTTIFHLNATYHLFEKKTFMQKLANLYENEIHQGQLSSSALQDHWHIQFLLVVALGKLFLGKGASQLGPPGAADFLCAMKLKPDVSDFYDEDPTLGTEILCLEALYLLSADMRKSSYVSVG
jgi:hypothetical protein